MPDEPAIVIISSEQRFVSCPACHTSILLDDIEQLDGGKVLCTHCGARLTTVVGNKPKSP